jgi:hypothetical protein
MSNIICLFPFSLFFLISLNATLLCTNKESEGGKCWYFEDRNSFINVLKESKIPDWLKSDFFFTPLSDYVLSIPPFEGEIDDIVFFYSDFFPTIPMDFTEGVKDSMLYMREGYYQLLVAYKDDSAKKINRTFYFPLSMPFSDYVDRYIQFGSRCKVPLKINCELENFHLGIFEKEYLNIGYLGYIREAMHTSLNNELDNIKEGIGKMDTSFLCAAQLPFYALLFIIANKLKLKSEPSRFFLFATATFHHCGKEISRGEWIGSKSYKEEALLISFTIGSFFEMALLRIFFLRYSLKDLESIKHHNGEAL